MSTLRSAEIGCLGTFDPSRFRNRLMEALKRSTRAGRGARAAESDREKTHASEGCS